MIFPVKKYSEVISQEKRSRISTRYKTVTRAINQEFYNSDSEVAHSLYVGSYGRGTAINTSDLDIMVILPEEEYEHSDSRRGNGQSRLLQSVREAIKNAYPSSDIRADGQVVKISFSDDMKFEILPAFENINYLGEITYTYPDSNQGGNWLSTNPKAEQNAIKEKNKSSNGLLVDTCRHLRYIRDGHFSSYRLSGIVIDSFVYYAICNWRWTSASSSYEVDPEVYERGLLKYWEENVRLFPDLLHAPGSGDSINVEKSNVGLEKVLRYMAK